VRKLVLEELLSGEVLEVWIIDPAFAHAFVGQSANMLEKKKPDHKLCRNFRPATVATERLYTLTKPSSARTGTGADDADGADAK